MGDKIDFNAALEDCNRVRDGIKSDEDFQNADSGLVMYYLNTIVQALEIAVTVKRGKWENTNTKNHLRCTSCDVIHFIAQYPCGKIDYCPNCGAKMDGGDHNE